MTRVADLYTTVLSKVYQEDGTITGRSTDILVRGTKVATLWPMGESDKAETIYSDNEYLSNYAEGEERDAVKRTQLALELVDRDCELGIYGSTCGDAIIRTKEDLEDAVEALWDIEWDENGHEKWRDE